MFRPVSDFKEAQRGFQWAGGSCESNPHQLYNWNPGRLSIHRQTVLPATLRLMAVQLQCELHAADSYVNPM